MAGLTVNLDQIGVLRASGDGNVPDPVAAAVQAELAGASGISVQLREDRSIIQDRDVRILKQTVQSDFILEMALTSEMVGVALDVKPDRVTLVPDRTDSRGPQEGLDLILRKSDVAEAVALFHSNGIPAGILIDPDPDQVKLAHQIDARIVEIHTGRFSRATSPVKREQIFADIVDTVKFAHKLRMEVYAGRGLGYGSVGLFRDLSEIGHFRIGHSIVARAVLAGMETAVRDMLTIAGMRP